MDPVRFGGVSVLGTAPGVVTSEVEERVGWFRRKMVLRGLTYLDWTVDGVPLRRLVAWPDGDVARDVTPVHYDARRGKSTRSTTCARSSGSRWPASGA